MASDQSNDPTSKIRIRLLAVTREVLHTLCTYTSTITLGIKGLNFHPHAFRVQFRAGQEIVMCQFNVTYISLVQIKLKAPEYGSECQVKLCMSQALGSSVSVYRRNGLDVLDPKTRPWSFAKRNEIAIERRAIRGPQIIQPSLRHERLRVWVHLLVTMDVDNRHRDRCASRDHPIFVHDWLFGKPGVTRGNAVGESEPFLDTGADCSKSGVADGSGKASQSSFRNLS